MACERVGSRGQVAVQCGVGQQRPVAMVQRIAAAAIGAKPVRRLVDCVGRHRGGDGGEQLIAG